MEEYLFFLPYIENITQLFECTMWFVDGTFRTAPTIFFQLFSILGDVKQAGVDRKPQIVALPFVHVLLENKRQVAYSKVFSIVIEVANDLSIVNVPSITMMDFEVSIINAAKFFPFMSERV